MTALIVFTAIMGLADAWLVAWSIGSVWGTGAAAGTVIGLMLSIAWALRHHLPAVSIGGLVTAIAMVILLSRSSPAAGFFSVLVALGIFGVWCLAYDVWFTGRTNAEVVSQVMTLGGDGSAGRALIVSTWIGRAGGRAEQCLARTARENSPRRSRRRWRNNVESAHSLRALRQRRTGMAFKNRAEAGWMLARRLAKYRGERPLVLAIPRGAVPMGKIVADALDGELDVVLVRKLRAPENPELAIGSIDETGTVYLDPDTRGLWDERYLEGEKKVQLETLQRRRQMYQPAGSAIDAAGRIVIVLDDGIATGSTMIAALRAVRARQPSKLIAATGVVSADVLRLIHPEADDVVCLETPELLYAIGYHFRDFSQVSDEEVVATLRAAWKPHATAASA